MAEGMSDADPTAALRVQVETLTRANRLLDEERVRLVKRNERLRLQAHRSEVRVVDIRAELVRRANPGPSIGRGDLGLVIRALGALNETRADELASRLAGYDWGG